jgi:uncharacterized protein (DUF488 family)
LSIGYQGKGIAELCERLSDAGVRVLLDVRERAWSHRPEYRKTALSNALSARGIRYLHFREAGNPYRPSTLNGAPVEVCARLYGQYLDENHAVVEDVADLLKQAPSALFCYEAEHFNCHRSVLLDRVGRIVHMEITEA